MTAPAGRRWRVAVVDAYASAYGANSALAVRFAEALAGHDEAVAAVSVVTPSGLADRAELPPPLRAHHADADRWWPVRALDALGARADRLGDLVDRKLRTRWPRGAAAGRELRQVHRWAAELRVVAAARHAFGSGAAGRPDAVVVAASTFLSPLAFAVALGRSTPMLVLVFDPDRVLRSRPWWALGGRVGAARASAAPAGRAAQRIGRLVAPRVAIGTASPRAPLDDLRRAFPALVVEATMQAGTYTPAGGVDRGEARRRLGVPGGAFVALCFGNWHPWKDNATVLRAAAHLGDAHHLLVAGRLPEAEARRTLTAAGVASERVTLLAGDVPAAEVGTLFAAADVLVLSFLPTFRGDSATLADGVSHDLAVVATSCGWVGDAVERFGLGAVFEPGDPEALAAALEALRTGRAGVRAPGPRPSGESDDAGSSGPVGPPDRLPTMGELAGGYLDLLRRVARREPMRPSDPTSRS